MHRLQPTARPGLGRTKVRQAAERTGSQHAAGGRTGAGGGRHFPPEGALRRVGRAGRRGRREAGTRAGRGLEGSAGSRDVTEGRVVCRYPSAGAAGPSSGA